MYKWLIGTILFIGWFIIGMLLIKIDERKSWWRAKF